MLLALLPILHQYRVVAGAKGARSGDPTTPGDGGVIVLGAHCKGPPCPIEPDSVEKGRPRAADARTCPLSNPGAVVLDEKGVVGGIDACGRDAVAETEGSGSAKAPDNIQVVASVCSDSKAF